MTHEELLVKIEKRYQCKYEGETDQQATTNALLNFKSALRAVIELHKESDWKTNGLENSWCSACTSWTYPCPTIQAIEKELA